MYVDFLKKSKTLDATQQKKAADKFYNSVCYFLKHGSCDTIIAHGGVGQMQFQSEGSRLLAMMSLSEAFECLGGNDSMQDHFDLFEHI